MLGIVGHTGIKLVEVYQPIIRQNGLHPDTRHVVHAWRHQHVGHSTPGRERVQQHHNTIKEQTVVPYTFTTQCTNMTCLWKKWGFHKQTSQQGFLLCSVVIYIYTYDLVPKGAHARGYELQLKIKHCWKLFLFKMLCCVLAWMNEYLVQIISATRLWLISRYSHHTQKKCRKRNHQKQTSMYRVIFITLLTNKSQAHGEPITDLYAENIVLYG